MTDSNGRTIEYMRISITDRCNLRCKYCMPEELPSISHDRILRYEELLRICGAAAELGITHFKVTGGEPFVRKGCVDFLRSLKALPATESVSVTTNGVLLRQHLPELAAMGLDGVNISLDTLDRRTFSRLTGQDILPEVLAALEDAVASGLRVKVNCVPMEGVNEDELTDLAGLAAKLPVDVRFIELMPTGGSEDCRPIPGETVRARLAEAYPDLRPANEKRGWGPARYFRADGLLGRVGFIDAVSNHFCDSCNRVRLTSEGYLKLCLYHEDGVSLRDPMRDGIDDAGLAALMKAAIEGKPTKHRFDESGEQTGIRHMWKIGG